MSERAIQQRPARSRFVAVSFIFCTLLLAGTATAEVKLPALIGDNMVVQQGRPVVIWGWADPGEQVTVRLAADSQSATADAAGKWKVQLPALRPGEPLEMTVTGKNSLTLHNILVGEVWVCSGQSNMEMPVNRSWSAGVLNYEDELAHAGYPRLRLFTVKHAVAGKPQEDVQGQWAPATSATVAGFSATAYFFGRHLLQTLNVPVGLIHSSWGGTEAEAWTSAEALDADPDLKPAADSWRQRITDFPQILAGYQQKLNNWEKSAEQAQAVGTVAPNPPEAPTDPRSHSWRESGLWNGMIAPLTPYPIAGVIWYQGESNAELGYQYRKVFPTMIQQWRQSWGEGDFPFLFVQIANWITGEPCKDCWATLRESQEKTLALPKTGMAVATDIGESYDIHPRNKQEVGRRLGLAADAIAYGRKIEYMGPAFASATPENGALRVQFTHAEGGLVAHGQSLTGFEIAGEDQHFFPAQARIKGAAVVLSSQQVSRPVAVRYAWEDDPKCSLYNQAGLPAPSFRSDEWPVSTQNLKRTEALKLW